MATSIVFFLLFFLPFVILPFGITQFEDSKVILAEAGIILLFFAQLFINSLQLRFRFSVIYLYTLILLLTIVDIFFFRSDITFFGNAFRMQGIFLLWLLLFFSFLSSSVSLKNIRYVWYIVILLGEVITLFFLPLNESERFVGTLGEPNALAAFAIFIWPFVFFGIKKFERREIASIIFVLALVGVILFLSQSRSAFIALGIQIAYIAFLKMEWSQLKTVIVCFGIYLLSYTLPFFQNIPYENRTEIWRSAIFAGTTAPIFGSGFGNTEISLHKAAQKLNLPIQYYYVDSAHNIFLDFWVEGGLIGLGSLIVLVVIMMSGFVKEKNSRNLALFLGMITVLSFNPASVVSLLGFWWLIGQGMKKT